MPRERRESQPRLARLIRKSPCPGAAGLGREGDQMGRGAPIPPAALCPSQEAFPPSLGPFSDVLLSSQGDELEKPGGKSALSAELPLRGTQLGLILEVGGYGGEHLGLLGCPESISPFSGTTPPSLSLFSHML